MKTPTIRPVSLEDSEGDLLTKTFATYREHIQPARMSDPGTIGLVWDGGLSDGVKGLVLGSVYTDQESHQLESTLMSVFVDPEKRLQGMGKALVEAFVAEASQRGVRKISVVFMDGKPSIVGLRRILAQTGWAEPAGRMIAIKQQADDALHPKHGWCRSLPCPQGIRVIPWTEVKEAQKEAIRQWQQATGEIPRYLCPDEVISHGPVNEATSVALEVEGVVLGWVLTQPLENGVLRFTASYVKRDMQRRALLMNLLYASVSSMQAAGFESGIWTVPAQDDRMYRFALKRIAPHSDYCRETVISTWTPSPAA